MKINLFNRNLFKVSLLMLGILLLLTNSCKKDSRELSDTELIQKAKEWFVQKKIKSYVPNWRQAKVVKIQNEQLLALPTGISYSSKEKINSVLLISMSDTKTSGYIAEFINSTLPADDVQLALMYQAMIKGDANALSNNFEGNAMLFSATHNFIEGWHLAKGRLVGRIYENSKTLKDKLKMSISHDSSDCYQYYWVERDAYTGEVLNSTYLYTMCDAAGGGSSDGGSGGSGAGSNGNESTNSKKVDVDPNARQCLKDIKAALEALGMKNTGTGSGLIASILNKLNLSKGENFNAIITEGNTSKANYIAETTPPNYNNITQNVVTEIKFNSTYLSKMTDLAAAGVMIHEYVHAYFSWNLYLMERNKQVDPKFKETYDLLFTEDGQINYSPEKDSQHEQIAKSFAGEISAMLKQYAISNQIPLPTDPEYFNKMAWAGLEKTSLYKFAPTGTNATLAAEQGLSGNKITHVIKCKQ